MNYPKRPLTADELRAYFDKLRETRYGGYGNRPASRDQLVYVNAGLTKLRAVRGDFDRYMVLLGLFGHCGNIDRCNPSSSQLDMAQASFIIDWLGATKENGYALLEDAQAEAWGILQQGLKEWGQLELFVV